MKSFQGFKKRIIKVKFWIQRVMSYVSVLNFFLLAYLVLDRLGVKLSFWKTTLFILVVIGISILLGYLEDRLGLAREEFELNAERMGLKK